MSASHSDDAGVACFQFVHVVRPVGAEQRQVQRRANRIGQFAGMTGGALPIFRHRANEPAPAAVPRGGIKQLKIRLQVGGVFGEQGQLFLDARADGRQPFAGVSGGRLRRRVDGNAATASRAGEPSSATLRGCGPEYFRVRSFPVPPPVFEGFPRHRRQIARFRPRFGRVERRAFHRSLQRLRQPADFFGQRPERRFVRHDAENLIRQPLEKRRLAGRGVAAVLQQMMVQINFHRARLGAGAAKRTGVGKMFPILQAAQMRRDDRADRAAVSRAVGVAADVAENRADVQARAAADAVQRVALLGVGEQFGAAIVEQDDVPFLRAVASRRAGAGRNTSCCSTSSAGRCPPSPASAETARGRQSAAKLFRCR